MRTHPDIGLVIGDLLPLARFWLCNVLVYFWILMRDTRRIFCCFLQDIPMDLTDIKPTIIDCEESQNILPKPRSFTFDNPAMVRILTDHENCKESV